MMNMMDNYQIYNTKYIQFLTDLSGAQVVEGLFRIEPHSGAHPWKPLSPKGAR